MNEDTRRNVLRFGALGAVSALAVGASALTFKALDPPESVPQVDGCDSEPPGGGEWPLVSIIVPARNEERNLPRILPTLLSQRYPNFEVLVVDDQSDDSTPHVLAEWRQRDPRLRVIQGADLPRHAGWLGKPHAMCQGAEAAGGSWLLFTDADTLHTPLTLASTVAYAIEQSIDLLSVMPASELETPIERLVMPIAFQGISTLFPPYRVNDPKSSVAIANGQFLLVRRDVYDAVGGAERVKGMIAEDLEFGKAVKGDGFRLYLADGRHLLSVRMYTNLRELWEGWSKNVVLSFRENPAAGALIFPGLLLMVASPVLFPVWAVRAWKRAARETGADRFASGWLAALLTFTAAAPVVYRSRVDRLLGLPPGWTLTQPIGAAIFGLIMLYSLVRLATGKGVVWKGRTYAERSP